MFKYFRNRVLISHNFVHERFNGIKNGRPIRAVVEMVAMTIKLEM